jgi:hypothetical protein
LLVALALMTYIDGSRASTTADGDFFEVQPTRDLRVSSPEEPSK